MAWTIELVQLYEQERQALAMLAQAQWQLIMVRGAQAATLVREADAHDEYVRGIEQEHERAEAKLEESERMLTASRAEALAYSKVIEHQSTTIDAYRAELAEYKAIVREGQA